MSDHEPLPGAKGIPAPAVDPVSQYVRLLKANADAESEAQNDQPPTPPPTPPPADTLDDFMAQAQPFASVSARQSASIQWIAQRAAFGVLRLCLRAATDPTGGLSFGATDIHMIDPELSRIYETSKVVGDVLGYRGQRGKDDRVHESGIDLPSLKPSRGARQYSPTVEAATRAILKLRSHHWSDEAIATELGFTHVAEFKSALGGLWNHARYSLAFPRGRRKQGGR